MRCIILRGHPCRKFYRRQCQLGAFVLNNNIPNRSKLLYYPMDTMWSLLRSICRFIEGCNFFPEKLSFVLRKQFRPDQRNGARIVLQAQVYM